MSNYDKFLSLFNECERTLQKRTELKSQSFASIINKARTSDRVIDRYYDDLDSFRKLRNVIVHGTTKAKLAEPYDFVINELSKIITALKNPPTAKDIMTSPVIYCDLGDSIANATQEMRSKQLTSIPIYAYTKLIGILSEQSIVNWIASKHSRSGFIASELKLSEIAEFFHPPGGTDFDKYIFTSPDTDAFTIDDLFLEAIDKGSRLNAVFVTHDGKPNNKMLGIITPWDLPRLRKKKEN
jgi:hypothetical protein